MERRERGSKLYRFEVKLEAVRVYINSPMSLRQTAEKFDIASASTLKKWVLAYRTYGEEGLVAKQSGRPRGHKFIPKTPPREVAAIQVEIDRLSAKLKG